jgi:DNA-binding MarR family transcriptional regulator
MSRDTPDTCSCAVLRQASRHVTRLYDEALAPAGLGLNQYSILAKLGRFGPETIHALAERLVMDRSTLGHLLRPLEARGLVSIGVSRTDRRQRDIALTEAGKTLLAEARPFWIKAEHRFQDVFGATAAESLRGLLIKVATTDFHVP